MDADQALDMMIDELDWEASMDRAEHDPDQSYKNSPGEDF